MFAAAMGTAGGGSLAEFGKGGFVFDAFGVDDDVAGMREIFGHLPEGEFDDIGGHVADS